MKKITLVNSENIPDIDGTVIKVEDTEYEIFSFYAKGDLEIQFSKSGTTVSISRKSDKVFIFKSLFSQITNGNTGFVFGSGTELQKFIAGFFNKTKYSVLAGATITDLFNNEKDMAYSENASLTNPGSIGSVIAVDASAGSLYSKLPVGFLSKIGKIRITTDNPVRITGAINATDVQFFNNGGSLDIDFILNAGSHDIDVSNVTFGSRGGFYFNLYAKSTIYPKVSIVFPLGSCITETKFPTAKLLVSSLGNSIARGNLGSVSGVFNSGETHYVNRISSSLRALGLDTRATKRGINGGLIADIVGYMNSALIGGKPFDLCILDPATNNAVSAVNAQFSTFLEYIIDWLFDWNPNMSIITVGASPSDAGGRATNLPGYRTAIQAVNNLAKYSSKRTANQLKYYDASAFVPLVNANFVEGATNNNLHPNGNNGHRLYAEGLLPIVQTTKFYLSNS